MPLTQLVIDYVKGNAFTTVQLTILPLPIQGIHLNPDDYDAIASLPYWLVYHVTKHTICQNIQLILPLSHNPIPEYLPTKDNDHHGSIMDKAAAP